ncbi:HNH endonuclease [Actinacidiphila sp. bgisy144]|uniref:HNH endonuclease n=1 Tax=Actinacidiphila sp. bgisy144 TaxID=3413791 RepID=UPI003EBE32AB
MWQAHHGPIPDQYVIRHDCDHSWCIRPECLRVGDQVDNVSDALRRDRLTHPGRVGKADRRGAAAAARAVRAAVLDAVTSGTCVASDLSQVVTRALAAGDPFADHGRLF